VLLHVPCHCNLYSTHSTIRVFTHLPCTEHHRYSLLQQLRVPPYSSEGEANDTAFHGMKTVLDGNGCVQLLNAMKKTLLGELFDIDVAQHAMDARCEAAVVAGCTEFIADCNRENKSLAAGAKASGDQLKQARAAENELAPGSADQPCRRELEFYGQEKLYLANVQVQQIAEVRFVMGANGNRKRAPPAKAQRAPAAAARLSFQRRRCGTVFMNLVHHLVNCLALAMTLEDKPGVDYEAVVLKYEEEVKALARIVNQQMTTKYLGVQMVKQGHELWNWP